MTDEMLTRYIAERAKRLQESTERVGIWSTEQANDRAVLAELVNAEQMIHGLRQLLNNRLAT